MDQKKINLYNIFPHQKITNTLNNTPYNNTAYELASKPDDVYVTHLGHTVSKMHPEHRKNNPYYIYKTID